MIIIQILTASLMYFLFKRLGEWTFWAQEWKGYTVSYAGLNAAINTVATETNIMG